MRVKLEWQRGISIGVTPTYEVEVGSCGDGGNRRSESFSGGILRVFKGGGAEEDAAGKSAGELDVSRIGAGKLRDVRLGAVCEVIAPDRSNYGAGKWTVEANVFGGFRNADP